MAARTAIGLDIGTSVVRAAELSYGRGGITLERYGQIVLPEEAVRDGEVVDGAGVRTRSSSCGPAPASRTARS